MSYQRSRMLGVPGIPGMGDGPITDPSQVDDTINAGVVNPTRVDCAALPDDSPWKRPGQVCAPTLWDRFIAFLSQPSAIPAPSPTPPPTPPAPDAAPAPPSGPSATPFLVLGGAVAAYYLLRKKKRM